MDSNLIISQDNFSFHLNGDSSVDAILLSKTIQDFAELTKIISQEQNPDAFIKLNVTAFENGSFIIDFQTITQLVETFKNNAELCSFFASIIVGGVVGVFKIKKFLKGEPPTEQIIEDNSIKIKNKNGDVLVAPKASAPILNNCKLDNLVINIALNSNDNNNGKGFTISSSGDNIVEINDEDIPYISRPIATSTERVATVKKQTIDTYLKIKKPVFVGPSKWTLIYKNNQIEAKIDDDDWLTSVQQGNIGINANHLLHAELQVEVELGENGIPLPDTKKYSVIHVFELVEDKFIKQLTL